MTNSPDQATPNPSPIITDEGAGAAPAGESALVDETAPAGETTSAGETAPADETSVDGTTPVDQTAPMTRAERRAAEGSTPAAGPDPVLDARTFDRIREPRGGARLPLGDGTWHQLARQYVWVQLISSGILLAMVVAAMLVLTLAFGQTWAWIPGGIITVLLVWTIAITPRQARSYGYQLRRDDLVFRRGILWQRVVAVPYGRMQLVDITHGPLDRGFGIAQLKLVTAAAATGVTIPGLTQDAAEKLRDTLIDVAETRRTGL
ncbi:PH domain-containing protein [Planococcus sp. APC 4015]|nr:PH domain-containing protein [Planococcus sp. APC 4015]